MTVRVRFSVFASPGASDHPPTDDLLTEDYVLDYDPVTTQVSDIAEMMGFEPGPLLIDGRRFSASVRLEDTGLCDGSVVAEPKLEPVDEEALPPVVRIETIAGVHSGQTQALPCGRFHLRAESPRLVEAAAVSSSTRLLFDIGPRSMTMTAVHVPVVVNGELLDRTVSVDCADTTTVNLGDTRLRITPWKAGSVHRRPVHGAVHRTPRATAQAPKPTYVAPVDPSPPGDPQPFSWIASAAPIPAAVIMALAFGRMTFMLFAILSPLAMIARWYEGKRRVKKETEQFNREIQLLRLSTYAQVMEARRKQTSHAREANPGPSDLVGWAQDHDVRLWERRPHHDDFALVTVAIGEAPWSFDPAVPAEVEDLRADINFLESVPIAIDLERGSLGIVGDRSRVIPAGRAVVAQLATLSGPADIPLAVVALEQQLDDWDWVKWLPHVGSPPRLATTEDGIASLVAAQSLTPCAGSRTGVQADPLAVFLVDGVDLLRSGDSSLRHKLAADSRIRAIVLADSEEDLPASISWVLTVHDDGTATVADVTSGDRASHVTPVGMDEPTVSATARALAGLTDPDAPRTAVDLPDRVALPSLTGPTDSASILRRWDSEGPDPDPTAIIGVGPEGPLELNLVGDGPHALLAGTTGSGKSELLRSLVLSVASRFSARTVNFVLVDYKGGGAFDACADLPHTVAVVTDLDGHLGTRALRSLQAELKYREKAFRDVGSSSLAEYRAAAGPLSRLVVVVDEFATLAADLPDVLDALIDIAQRGRSLGIHMVLATQRPAGVVDAKIRSNTNLRISLRVQDDSDSQDVLGTYEAARLRRGEVGRGFVRTGAGEITPFQTAYAGGVSTDRVADRTSIDRFVLRQKSAAETIEDSSQPTDLERMVTEIVLAHEKAAIPDPRKPWLPALASTLSLDELPHDHDVVIGLFDVPSEQRRHPLTVAVGTENLLIYGVDHHQTTASLQTIAVQAMRAHGPDDLHLYVLDSGACGLQTIRTAPHVGAYLVHDNDDLVDRALALIEGSITERKDAQTQGRRCSDLPTMLVLIDGFGGLLERLNEASGHAMTARIGAILRECARLGISVVGTVASDRQIPGRIANHATARLLHQLADPSSVVSFGLRPRVVPALRGPMVVDPSTGLDGMVATVTDAELECLLDSAQPATRRPPRQLQTLPSIVHASQMMIEPAHDSLSLSLPFGVRMKDVEPVSLSIHDVAVVLGPTGSGKTTALAQLAQQAVAADLADPIVVVARAGSPLAGIPGVAVLDAGKPADVCDLSSAAVVFVDDAATVSTDLSKDLRHFAESTGPGRWMIAAMKPFEIKSMMEWTSVFRRASGAVVLQPQITDGDTLRVTFSAKAITGMRPGQGLLVAGAQTEPVQAAIPAD